MSSGTGASRRGWSLSTKLILATVALLAAVIGSGVIYSVSSLDALATSDAALRRSDGEKAMRTQAERLIRNLAASAGVPMAEGNFTYVKSLVQAALEEDHRIAWLIVFDAQRGQVVERTPDAPAKARLDDPAFAALQTTAADQVLELRDPANPQILVYGVNVTVGQQRMAQIRLGFSTADLETALARSIDSAERRVRGSARKQIIVAGILLMLGVLLGLYEGVRITRPLQALSMQAARIAGGDFEQRVHVTARDEIGQLADNFNTMAESLGVLLQEMSVKASLERELELARSVQELMSPPPALTTVGPFALAGHCEMATQCGGDWWTFRALSGGRLLLVIGDVTGHGMPAAMIAATGRGAVEALAGVDDRLLTPQLVLEAIDSAIRDVGNSQLLMTCFAAVLDPVQGVIRYANAGHTFPYVGILDGTGKLTDLHALTASGNQLGNPVRLAENGQRVLRAGEVLILYTDGLADRLSPSFERFSEKRLRRLISGYRMQEAGDRGIADLRDHIVGEVARFAGDQSADDDLTVVVCRFSGKQPQQEAPGRERVA